MNKGIKLFLSIENRFKRPKAYNDNEGSMENFLENLIIDENSDEKVRTRTVVSGFNTCFPSIMNTELTLTKDTSPREQKH